MGAGLSPQKEICIFFVYIRVEVLSEDLHEISSLLSDNSENLDKKKIIHHLLTSFPCIKHRNQHGNFKMYCTVSCVLQV